MQPMPGADVDVVLQRVRAVLTQRGASNCCVEVVASDAVAATRTFALPIATSSTSPTSTTALAVKPTYVPRSSSFVELSLSHDDVSTDAGNAVPMNATSTMSSAPASDESVRLRRVASPHKHHDDDDSHLDDVAHTVSSQTRDTTRWNEDVASKDD